MAHGLPRSRLHSSSAKQCADSGQLWVWRYRQVQADLGTGIGTYAVPRQVQTITGSISVVNRGRPSVSASAPHVRRATRMAYGPFLGPRGLDHKDFGAVQVRCDPVQRGGGHDLSANTNAVAAADISITATRAGLFRAVASALGVEALMPAEPVALRELWPLLPETVDVPLTEDVLFPALLFSPDSWPDAGSFSRAEVSWIPRQVHALYGQDHAKVKDHLDRYPALRSAKLRSGKGLGPGQSRRGRMSAPYGRRCRARFGKLADDGICG